MYEELNPIMENQEIILLSGNAADSKGRTPFHDLAMIQGDSPEKDAVFAAGAEEMIGIYLKIPDVTFGILDKDNDDKTALDLALGVNPEVKSVKKIFIKHFLLANPELAKPSFTESQLELSNFWDTRKQEASAQLTTNLQAGTSSSSAAFFGAPTSSNSPAYLEEENVQAKRPRLN